MPFRQKHYRCDLSPHLGSNTLVPRLKGVNGGERTEWTPRQLHDTPDAFISQIKTSLPFRPSVTMEYLFLSPSGSHRTVGGPIMSIRRSYTMHHQNSTKAKRSSSRWPFRSLYGGVFLSGAEAKHYGNYFRVLQGKSFAVEGIAGAKELLAENVERAREVGDTLGVHVSLLPLALLSGVNGDGALAARAVVDVSRVTKSAAARHRSLRNLCDSIQFILGSVAEWAQALEPILRWEDSNPVDTDSDASENGGQWNPKTRCRSPQDLLQTWLRTAHLFFWRWRCEVLRYLDADYHSDVAVVKSKVKAWIEEISSSARMGLRLPVLRWHEHGRTIADGKRAFVNAVTVIRQRLSSLSAWLHCLDLSLAWDAAKVCGRVHVRHLEEQGKIEIAPQGGWPHLLGFHLSSNVERTQENSLSLPTTVGLLQLQRDWLDNLVAAAHIRDRDAAAAQNNGKRRARRRDKSSAASAAAAIEEEKASRVRYVPAPVTPGSSRTPEGVDVRQAVVRTLREDVVPEAFAHEISLMKYAVDTKIDKSLHDSIYRVLTSVLMPNPFPLLTDALAVSSTSLTLSQTTDSEEAGPPAAVKLVEGCKCREVFLATGTRKDAACVYGSKPALTDVDADVALSLFDVLPPVAGWVLDTLGGSCADIDVGIFGCAQRYGSYVHHALPSDLTVMVACACDFDLSSNATPMEYFARCAVHCATTAHKKSALSVFGLTARVSSEDDIAASRSEGTSAPQPFSLQQVLSEPEEVEVELAYLKPEEIVLEALVPFPISTGGGEGLVPLSIRLILATSGCADGDDVGGCSQALADSMLYECVYSTATAAENAAARHAVLTGGSDLSESHVKRTRRRVLDKVDSRDYLEAYRLVHCLRCLQVAIPEDEEGVPTAAATTPESEADPSGGEVEHTVSSKNAWKIPLDSWAAGTESRVVGVATEIKRMTRGPAGRIHHARRLFEVMRKVLSKTTLQSAMVVEWITVGEHAAYCTSYLLDTLAEQPLARFEGAVQSINLRSRLLVDRVADIAGNEGLRGKAGATRGADGTMAVAYDLASAVASMLEIVQLSVESDTHRCCPEIDRVFEYIRATSDNKTGNTTSNAVRKGGRRATVVARTTNETGGGARFGRNVQG